MLTYTPTEAASVVAACLIPVAAGLLLTVPRWRQRRQRSAAAATPAAQPGGTAPGTVATRPAEPEDPVLRLHPLTGTTASVDPVVPGAYPAPAGVDPDTPAPRFIVSSVADITGPTSSRADGSTDDSTDSTDITDEQSHALAGSVPETFRVPDLPPGASPLLELPAGASPDPVHVLTVAAETGDSARAAAVAAAHPDLAWTSYAVAAAVSDHGPEPDPDRVVYLHRAASLPTTDADDHLSLVALRDRLSINIALPHRGAVARVPVDRTGVNLAIAAHELASGNSHHAHELIGESLMFDPTNTALALALDTTAALGLPAPETPRRRNDAWGRLFTVAAGARWTGGDCWQAPDLTLDPVFYQTLCRADT